MKHSKYKNTGLLYELLVRQVAADTLQDKKSYAVKLLQKYFSKNTPLAKEYSIYEEVLKNTSLEKVEVDIKIGVIQEICKTINVEVVEREKYNLIREIKQYYNIKDLFTRKVQDYRTLASLNQLIEVYKSSNPSSIEIGKIVENKLTLTRHLLNQHHKKDKEKNEVLEEYLNSDKDIKLLTFKILVSKYNKKYESLSSGQKTILREYINSVGSISKMRTLLNTEILKLKKLIENKKSKVGDTIIKIKLNEISKIMETIPTTKKLEELDIVKVLQYHELVHELNKV